MLEQQNERISGNAAIGLAGLPRTDGLVAPFEESSANRDLLSARAVQSRLLPHRSLSFADLLCETYYRPFHTIGGDYYDFVPLDRNRLGIAVGDVSGKGVGAALIMASLQASLRARLLHPGTEPPALVRSLNQSLYQSSHAHVYATLFYGEYDPESRVLTYVNAGHTSPLIARRDADRVGIVRLESDGPPVGALPDAVYEERRCVLRPGDAFVAYTDGITEASGGAYEQWGSARLEAVLEECAGMHPADVVLAILKARERFTCSLVAEDDMTLLVASVEG
jgi:sigma-B regulation protein RsbU (phosphoserine phosphatase)